MGKKFVPTEITPAIKARINSWQKFADETRVRHLKLSSTTNLPFQAKTCNDNDGACPCFGRRRPFCPCPEMWDELIKDGHCFCRIFNTPEEDEKQQAMINGKKK